MTWDSAKFADLDDAGRKLAATLAGHSRKDTLVLAIANGGIPVALPVAEALHAPFDLIAIRRLFAATDGDQPIAAASIAGNLVLDPHVSRICSSATTVEDRFIGVAMEDLSARVNTLRGDVAPKGIAGKDVIVIDNGIHTGGTIKIAIRALRSLKPSKITVGIPVANANVKDTLEAIADSVCCLHWSENFGHAGLWYKNFNRPSDEQIRTLMRSHSRQA